MGLAGRVGWDRGCWRSGRGEGRGVVVVGCSLMVDLARHKTFIGRAGVVIYAFRCASVCM